jgi:DMSO/TMAO reductase YedYZ molybdopterin-dependent catalytic subunit
LECAENPVGGGMVSHAEWTGYPLASLLEAVEAGHEAKFVRLSGADGFARSIPISKARHPDTLIAYNMNGERLPANHGFPLRAVIPGWYGMDSVKWLSDIEILTGEDTTPAMRERYVRMTRTLLGGPRPSGPVTAMNVNSVFSRPVDGAILLGRRFTIRGAAWAGENRVARVEVSTNGGKTWQTARLEDSPRPYSWVRWTFDWKIPASGRHELSVRASDEQGRKQPAERAAERSDPYEWNIPQTVRITVT